MNIQPLITVITTTKNNGHNLEETIQSVITQTYPHWELIIKDKNSTDTTLDIIKKYEKNISYWESSSDQNIYDGLNIAAAHATGAWTIVIQAGDTLYDRHVFETIAPRLSENSSDLVYGNVVTYRKEKQVLQQTKPPSYLPYGMIGSHQGMFIRTSLLQKFPYDISYRIAADYDFLWKCVDDGVKFTQVDQIIAKVDGAGVSSINQIENHQQKNLIALKYSKTVLPTIYRFIKRLRIRLQLKKHVKKLLAAMHFGEK